MCTCALTIFFVGGYAEWVADVVTMIIQPSSSTKKWPSIIKSLADTPIYPLNLLYVKLEFKGRISNSSTISSISS